LPVEAAVPITFAVDDEIKIDGDSDFESWTVKVIDDGGMELANNDPFGDDDETKIVSRAVFGSWVHVKKAPLSRMLEEPIEDTSVAQTCLFKARQEPENINSYQDLAMRYPGYDVKDWDALRYEINKSTRPDLQCRRLGDLIDGYGYKQSVCACGWRSQMALPESDNNHENQYRFHVEHAGRIGTYEAADMFLEFSDKWNDMARKAKEAADIIGIPLEGWRIAKQLAEAALYGLAGTIPTPAEGFLKSPGSLRGAINELKSQRDAYHELHETLAQEHLKLEAECDKYKAFWDTHFETGSEPDSVDNSVRAPHQQRVYIERDALKAKMDKLEEFIQHNGVFDTLPFVAQQLLATQLSTMEAYLTVLNTRISLFL
jgi:hypothetical protein